MSVTYYFTESIDDLLAPSKDELNILFHINTFAWPTVHRHRDYWEFTIVTCGVLINKDRRGSRQYEANRMFVSTTQSEHCVLASGKTPIRYINIPVRESYLLRLLDSVDPILKSRISAPNFSVKLPASTVQEIEQNLQLVDNFDVSLFEENNICKESVLLLILSHVLKESATAKLHSKNDWQNKLSQLLQSGELVRYNVSKLCETLGYSRTHLNLLFKKYYNTTPHEYLTNNKFSYAKTLLRCTNLSAEEISVKIGYANSMQFFTTFKKLYGVSPMQYRRNPQIQ